MFWNIIIKKDYFVKVVITKYSLGNMLHFIKWYIAFTIQSTASLSQNLSDSSSLPCLDVLSPFFEYLLQFIYMFSYHHV